MRTVREPVCIEGQKHAPLSQVFISKRSFLPVWRCCSGVIYYSLLQPCQNIAAVSSRHVVETIHDDQQKFWLSVWKRKGPILLQFFTFQKSSDKNWRCWTTKSYLILPFQPTSLLPVVIFLLGSFSSGVLIGEIEVENASQYFIDSHDFKLALSD